MKKVYIPLHQHEIKYNKMFLNKMYQVKHNILPPCIIKIIYPNRTNSYKEVNLNTIWIKTYLEKDKTFLPNFNKMKYWLLSKMLHILKNLILSILLRKILIKRLKTILSRKIINIKDLKIFFSIIHKRSFEK